MMMRSFFGRQLFLLNTGGASYVCRVFIPIKTRIVPLEEIKSFRERTANIDSESGQISLDVEMQTLGEPLRFASNITQPECDWLVDQLNDCLKSLGGGTSEETELPSAEEKNEERADPPDEESFKENSDDEAEEKKDRYALRLTKSPRQAPSDSRWRRIDDFDSTSFVERGRFALGTLGGMLFINLFWNGIVSVFLGVLLGLVPGNNIPPVGAAWWGLCVFLIPFEVIGLIMFAALIVQIVEPIRRTCWKFGRQEIECRWSWLGLGRTWTYPIKLLSRLEIHLVEMKKSNPRSANFIGSQEADRSLLLIDKDNAEFCSVKRLTEGEARWIGDFLLRERETWFE
jgi:hypothetical protein